MAIKEWLAQKYFKIFIASKLNPERLSKLSFEEIAKLRMKYDIIDPKTIYKLSKNNLICDICKKSKNCYSIHLDIDMDHTVDSNICSNCLSERLNDWYSSGKGDSTGPNATGEWYMHYLVSEKWPC